MASGKEIKAGKAYVELTAKDKISKGLEAAKKKLHAFGSSVSAVGKRIMLIGGAAAAAATIAVAAFMGVGDSLDKMSGRTGASVEWLSEMKFAAQQSGAAIEDLEAALKGMNNGFAEAKKGEGEFLKGLKMIGVSMKDIQNMSVDERFEYLSEKIAGIQDPAMKAKVAMLLFSEAGLKLLPMLGSIKELRKEAAALGLTISGKSAKGAADLSDAWGRLAAMFKVFLFEVGAALAPMLQDVAAKVQTVFSAVLKWVKENKETVATIGKVIVGVIAFGAALVTAGGIIIGIGATLKALVTIISVVSVAIGAVGTVISFLLSPVGLVLAAVVGLAAYVLYATGAMSKALEWFGSQWKSLKAYALETFEGIKNAMKAGDLELAMKILWLSIKEIWLKGTQPLRELWIGIKAMMSDAWTDVIYGLLAGWDAAVFGITEAWYGFTAFFGEAWAATVGGVLKIWNKAIGGIMKAWTRLKGLFSDDIDVEAEVKKIDDGTAGKNQAIDDETADRVRQNGEGKRQREQQREREKAALNGARDQEKQENQNKYADEMKGISDALEAVRREREAALEEARRKAAETGKKKEIQADRIETAVDNTKGSTKGSFYADQISGMQGNSDAKRTADGVQQLVKDTQETNRILKRGGTSTALKFS